MTRIISKRRAASTFAWGMFCLIGAVCKVYAAEFEITADSFTVDKQVNLSSAAYFQGQASAPGSPASATQLASPGGLYFDGTYYNVWNSQTGAWVQIATGTVETGRVARSGDTMTGQLTLAGSTLTVTGNAFSVGGSTLVVTNGGVGVGTAAPAVNYRLHVVNTAGDANERIEAAAGSSAAINFRDAGAANANVYMGTENGTGGNLVPGSSPYSFVINNAAARGIQLGAGNAVKMTIASSGNVGIGTPGPQSPLHVATSLFSGGDIATAANAAISAVIQSTRATNAGTFPDQGYQLALGDSGNTTGAADRGGGIAFQSPTGTAGEMATYAGIRGLKENATSGNYSGYLQIYTRPSAGSNAERMRITSSGNVGIGTTGPLVPLVVSNAGAQGLEFNPIGAGPENAASLQSYNRSTSANAPLAYMGSTHDFWTPGTGYGALYINSSGNVGVGTTNPSTPLDVVKTGSGEQTALEIENRSSNVPGVGTSIAFNVGTPGLDGYGMARIEGLREGASGTQGALEFYTGNSGIGSPVQAMYINSAQNVGIGTTSPGYKLDVAGQINTNTGVSMNGALYTNPDYVFEPGYKLMPLDKLETFTDTNKHLPHVPSTREVKKKGVEIFEQNRVVLENLEAAYRYIFQLNAKFKEQQAEIDALRTELKKENP